MGEVEIYIINKKENTREEMMFIWLSVDSKSYVRSILFNLFIDYKSGHNIKPFLIKLVDRFEGELHTSTPSIDKVQSGIKSVPALEEGGRPLQRRRCGHRPQ